MENKDLDELLEKIFANINSWLNFAEAKNGANIALVIACIVAILGIDEISFIQYVICVLFACSGICSLYSFIPREGVKFEKLIAKLIGTKKNPNNANDNLVFYGDIWKYTGVEYLKQLNQVYFNKTQNNYSKYQEDIASEIVYNAGVTSLKYKLFKCATYADIIAFIIWIVCFICA